MSGSPWHEVSLALQQITPICTLHDNDGIDIYFLNHRNPATLSPSSLSSAKSYVAPGGYYNIRSSEEVAAIFQRIKPSGGTPTGTRLDAILRPYLNVYASYQRVISRSNDPYATNPLKPINIIILTDGVPTDDLESVILTTARKLDGLEAPAWQAGLQFFQVGKERGAAEALQELDDELEGKGARDIVDTVAWRGGNTILNGDGILKVVLGAVIRRLDRRQVPS
jgi:hypothetical protein